MNVKQRVLILVLFGIAYLCLAIQSLAGSSKSRFGRLRSSECTCTIIVRRTFILRPHMSCGAGVSFKRCPELCSCQLEQLESFNHATSLQVPRLHQDAGVSVSPYRVRRQNNSVYYVLDPGLSSCQGCRCKVRLESTASSQLHRPAKCHGIHPAYVLSVAPHHVSLLQLEEEVLSRHDEVSSPLRICRCRRSAVPLVAWQVRIAASRSRCVESGFCIPLFRSASRGSEHF